MSGPSWKLLVVEPDPGILELLVSALSRRFAAHITCVADAEACLDVVLIERHDLIITELELTGWSGLKLIEQLTALSSDPVVLLADSPPVDTVVEAMRLGVRDLFLKPFPVSDLLDATDRALHGLDIRRKHATKYRRMRELVRRVIRERRELNRRMDLICRDLVGAHRRLVHRVLQAEQARPVRAN